MADYLDPQSAPLRGAVGEITAVSSVTLKKISEALVALGYAELDSGEESSLAARVYKEQDAEKADPLVVFGSGGVGAIIGLNGGALWSVGAATGLAIAATSLKYLVDRDRRMNAVVAAVANYRRGDRG